MKVITIIYLLLLPALISAQSKVVKYYDASWEPSDIEKSTYTAEFTEDKGKYKCIFYWKGSAQIAGSGVYADTTLAKPFGLVTGYYKGGILEDSSYYGDDGKFLYAFHYYKNGKLEVHYDASNNSTDAFDENGKKIKNYVYQKEAEYKGGDKAWKNYIIKNVTYGLKSKGNEEETVSVKILFAINEIGNTANLKILQSSGNKQVDNDAMRVIISSPQWKNAIYLNKPVKVYRIQSITYTLNAKNK